MESVRKQNSIEESEDVNDRSKLAISSMNEKWNLESNIYDIYVYLRVPLWERRFLAMKMPESSSLDEICVCLLCVVTS